MSDILFVTWDGGGNVPPALGIARELRARGHRVRFLGHATQEQAVLDAGFGFVRPTHAQDFRNRTDYSTLRMLSVFADTGMGRDLLEEVRRRPVDLVVVDGLMFGALAAAADAGLRYAVLEHMYDDVYRRSMLGGPMGLNLRLRRLRPRGVLASAAARLLTTVPSLDPLPDPPANLRRVGPVVEVAPRVESEPSVLVSLSTFAYPRMRECLQSVLDATRLVGVPAVVTTGPAVDPADLAVPEGVRVHRFVPHAELMPSASLLVGHGGHGTTMQALAHDLPVLVMPMDRLTDQPTVGRTVAGAGAGAVVRKGASAQRLAPVLERLLAEDAHRAAAARLGAEIRALPGATLGADVVEELVAGRRPAANGAG